MIRVKIYSEICSLQELLLEWSVGSRATVKDFWEKHTQILLSTNKLQRILVKSNEINRYHYQTVEYDWN